MRNLTTMNITLSTSQIMNTLQSAKHNLMRQTSRTPFPRNTTTETTKYPFLTTITTSYIPNTPNTNTTNYRGETTNQLLAF